MIEEKKSGIFLTILCVLLSFWAKIWNQKPKITPNFILIHRKATKTSSYFSCCRDISKWRLWRIQIENDVVKFFSNLKRFLSIFILLPSFTIIWLEITHYQKKTVRKLATLIMFSSQAIPMFCFAISKDTLDNCLECVTSLVKTTCWSWRYESTNQI